MGVSVCRWWYLWLLAHSMGSPCKWCNISVNHKLAHKCFMLLVWQSM